MKHLFNQFLLHKVEEMSFSKGKNVKTGVYKTVITSFSSHKIEKFFKVGKEHFLTVSSELQLQFPDIHITFTSCIQF